MKELTSWICLLVLGFVYSQDGVIICTGKINFQNANVDLKTVKMESTTMSGAKKYEVILEDDASYSIPVDSPNQSIYLRPVSSGFLFEPRQYKLTKTELQNCASQSYDFTLAGFQVQSKVKTAKNEKPLKSTTVTLTEAADGSNVMTSVSDQDGVFGFDSVKPGKYFIEASSEGGIRWAEAKITCHVAGPVNSKECSDVIFMAEGFNVAGSISADGSPLSGVKLQIKTENDKFCKKNENCVATSNGQGVFEFSGVPEGKFEISPVEGKLMMKFNPQILEENLSHQSIQLQKPFELKSYRINGKVDTQNQQGLGVELIDGGKSENLKLKNKNEFQVSEAHIGKEYTLQANSKDFDFDQVKVEISHPKNAKQIVLKASKVRVCGKVTQEEQVERQIEFLSNQGKKFATQTSKTGEFCLKVAPGQYSITAGLTESERNKGFLMAPGKISQKVSDKPIEGIKFGLQKLTVSGKVMNLSKEEESTVSIILKDSAKKLVSEEKLKDGKFKFVGIKKGNYYVAISGENLCFESQEKSIKVTGEEADVEVSQAFSKTGYSLEYESTHKILKVSLKSKQKTIEEINIEAGKHSLCVPLPGTYKLVTPHCYGFQEKELKFETGKNQVLKINPVRFGIEGKVELQDSKTALQLQKIVNIRVNNQATELKKSKGSENKWSYFYSAEPKQELKIRISPKTGVQDDKISIYRQFLISPDSLEVSVDGTCHQNINFLIKMGRIVKGKVVPEIPGVEIIMKKGAQVLQKTLTDSEGRYELAPVDAAIKFELDAQKTGYQMIKTEKGMKDEDNINFKLKKLSSLIVEIFDKETKEPISNVIHLLSSVPPNSAVESAPGRYMFTNIKQGKQRLQVMLREYEFENQGIREIEIKEGEQHAVTIYAKRVSFSAYGAVTDLSMKPVKNALIIAECMNAVCENSVNEGVTNSKGQFRIEELKPQGQYRLRLAKGKTSDNEQEYGQSLESKIHASVPNSMEITMAREDVKNLEFMVKLFSANLDINGIIELEGENPKDYKQVLEAPKIQIELYSTRGQEKELVQAHSLTASHIFTLTNLHRNHKYELVVIIDSRIYKNTQIEIVANEEAERQFQRIKISRNESSQGDFEMEHGSPAMGLLILAGMVGGFVFYKRGSS